MEELLQKTNYVCKPNLGLTKSVNQEQDYLTKL
jgi:hypothetical protein